MSFNSTLIDNFNGLEYETRVYTDVTETYESGNSLQFNGKNLNPQNYPYGVFFVILTSSETLGKATVYLVILSNTANASGIELTRIDSCTGTQPILTKLSSGGAGVIWSASAVAKIRTSIFKLYS